MADPTQARILVTEPVSVFMFLLAVTGIIFYISEFPRLKRFFHYLPPLIFCYFAPMIATTLGVIPEKNALYDWFNKVFLCPILLLLLVSADFKAIARLGPVAIGVMFAGTLGVMIGAVLGYALFSGQLDPEGWKNVGSLAASWTGGSANMFAVKAAYEIPDPVFSPMIVVDSVMVYSWLGILIAFAGAQEAYARRFGVNERITADMGARVREFAAQENHAATTRDILVILAIGLVGGHLCNLAGAWLNGMIKPFAKTSPALSTFSPMTIAIIFVTALGILLSFSPVRRFERVGASRVGYAMLFLLLPTFGAQANLREFGMIPWYAAVGAVMLAFHAIFIFAAMRLLRAPLFFGAVGSQANVGGPASASIVASTYQQALAPVGILLGILGGITGTYVGLVTAQLCRFFAP